ncbi:hypothetical protein [Acetonema longum]|uniref:Uncharacterized protein n=1 Tax=Acetonema longum DSM 6540 TaxID=1009370 RepID=F7NEA6_9FIRM|nr:hypothetical protein [Acetonema longum]EGO65618.1 hypothetical protein ALO_01844 [Acetonema longum DSM 6540]
MPYTKGRAASLEDLLAKIAEWATDADIHGDDAWELMRQEAWPRGTIFKAKGLNGENSCYIGMLPLTLIKDKTYKEWLFASENIGKHLIWPAKGLNLKGASYSHTAGATSFNAKSKAYSFSDPDIVINSGSALVFGVFKQYAEGLDWNEQPGGIEFGDLKFFPLRYSVGRSQGALPAPLYPGVGYPGIGMPAGEPVNGYFDYWLAKDACRLTVVIHNAGQWDMGHAGMLIPFHAEMQYAFPAVVAGSTNGLRGMATTERVGESTVVRNGVKIDFSYDKWDLSRNLPHAPCFDITGGTREASNLGLCLPDGRWRFFHNFTQELKTNSQRNGDGSISYWFTLERPVRDANSEFVIKPMHTDLMGIRETLSREDTITVEALQLVQNSPKMHTTNLFGSLWRMAWPGADGPYGETRVNGKLCLLLPNCWEDRLWYILTGGTGITDPTILGNLYKEIIEYGKQFRILIRLED